MKIKMLMKYNQKNYFNKKKKQRQQNNKPTYWNLKINKTLMKKKAFSN